MTRDLILMSGEYNVTMPLVFKRDRWWHSMKNLDVVIADDGTFSYGAMSGLKGCIIYASADDTTRRIRNLDLLLQNNIHAWPDPKKLKQLENRHDVMKMCIDANLVTDRVIQRRYGECIDIDYPFVVKTGNLHVGEGKHFCKTYMDIPEWDEIATAEKFYEGRSTRVLFIGDKYFGLEYTNDSSWIKNSVGADVLKWDVSNEVLKHSIKIKKFFGLDICGIDYVVEPSGKFHFLEYNQFPGLYSTEEISSFAAGFLNSKMDMLENKTF